MQSSLFKQSERNNGDGREISFLVACLLDELFVIESINNYYLALFCHSEDRVAMLNRVAQVLFATIQDSLLDEMTVRFARLIDKERICGNETFTLNRFDAFSQGLENPDAYSQKLSRAKEHIDKAFKDTRNQYLAHLQLDPLLDGTKFSYASSLNVREAITSCVDFVEEAEKQFDIPRLYFPNHEEDREVDKFLEVLEKGYEQILPKKWWKKKAAGNNNNQGSPDE